MAPRDRARRASGVRRVLRSRRVVVLAVLGLVVLGLALLPPVQARGKAGATMAEALGADLPRPFAASIERRTVELGGVGGHLYTPGERAPAVVVLAGATREGKNDPRVVGLARALARGDRVVYVPDLRLHRLEVDPGDIGRVVRSVAALRRLPAVDGDVVLLGFSFGGSYGLVASADPRIRDSVALVATFGSYYRTVGLVQALSTGVSLVGGRRVSWDPNPDTKIVLRKLAYRLVEPDERARLAEVFHGRARPAGLPRDVRAVYAFTTHDDPTRTRALAARLDRRAHAMLARFSPATIAGRLPAPLVAMHARDDPVVPHAELVRLDRALPEATTLTVSSFEHVDFGADNLGQAARDLFTVWRFGTHIFDAQE
ncbi:MAG: alpha/beta fold hydrolase [Carbonactinosporaceae bacterium]